MPQPHQMPDSRRLGARLLADCGISRLRYLEAINAHLPQGGICLNTLNNVLTKNIWPSKKLTKKELRSAMLAAAADLAAPTHRFFWADPHPQKNKSPRRRQAKSIAPPPQEKEKPMHISREELTQKELETLGLGQSPFDEIEDFENIYQSRRTADAIEILERTLSQRGIAAMYGPVGSGKSTILRHLIKRLRADARNMLIFPDCLNRENLDGSGIVLEILHALGVAKLPGTTLARTRLMRQELEQAAGGGKIPILIIDEAHDLPTATLVALKRLWDSSYLHKLVAILIAGQGQTITRRGNSDDHYGLAQTLHHHADVREFTERARLVGLGSLGRDLPDYLAWCFARASADVRNIITPDALKIIAARASTPQMANNICIKAMKAAAALGEAQVLAEHIPEMN